MGTCEAHPRPQGFLNTPMCSVRGRVDIYQDVQLAVTEIFCILGVPAYHSSVILDGLEYYFDADGITSAPPFWSHGGPRNLLDDLGAAGVTTTGRCFSGCRMEDCPAPKCVAAPEHLKTQVFKVGKTSETGESLVDALAPFFEPGSYDVLHKNCNAFSDVALSFLTHRRLELQYTRMERMLLAAEPLSTGILNQLFRAVREKALVPSDEEKTLPDGSLAAYGEDDLREYIGNPVAQGFSIDSVVTLLLQGESIDEEIRPDDGTGCCGRVESGSIWSCGPLACSSAGQVLFCEGWSPQRPL